MAKLRDDTVKAAAELVKLGTRFGMEVVSDMGPAPRLNFQELEERADQTLTSCMTLTIGAPKDNETHIPVAMDFVSPSSPDRPQSRHFTRMILNIITSGSDHRTARDLDASKIPLPGDNRTLKFTVKKNPPLPPGSADAPRTERSTQLAESLASINAYLDADPAQEKAVRDALMKASYLENEFSDSPRFTRMTKVSPTFRLEPVTDTASGKTVNEPVFGAKIQTSDPMLVLAAMKVRDSNNPGIKITNTTFDRTDVRHIKDISGKLIVAEGAALKGLMEMIGTSRDDVSKRLAASYGENHSRDDSSLNSDGGMTLNPGPAR